MGFAIRVLRSTWVAKYEFDLDPVSVERIDVLESKLRDQQEELEKLRGKLKKGKTLLFIKLTATTKNGSSILCWQNVQSDDFVSTGMDGIVKVRRRGVYSVGVIVNAVPGASQNVQLLKNGTLLQAVDPGYSQGYNSSAALNTIEHLEEDDELSISCLCNLSATSYLTIAKMGA
ncbi:hypothetical protein GN244_ATG13255 [Phytophthora infestans]|uniref:Uncharacterized protein n=1 Tax=Phytophthora infestans TaxID=4787 RepID=A0A833SXX0_PHYIN|nr:hypothetical protein GN244_ATG13255 [Phytophthora infestans]